MHPTGETITGELAQSTPGMSGIRRLLVPSLSDFFFVSILIWLFMLSPDGWSRLLLDGDTGWHIRTGEWILEHRAVPAHDLFSFSKEGAPWFAWEWLTDVVYAAIHGAAGLKGIALLAGLQIALYATVLMRQSLERGANGLIGLGVVLLAVGASSVHHLARPHLATLVLVPVSIWMIDIDRRAAAKGGSWILWMLVPLTALWTNLHGGFLALIACVGLLLAGTAIETLWRGDGNWRSARRYAALFGACSLATFVNPYGYHLHEHIASYLQSDWIRNAIEEFQSPRFRSENMLQFEIVLFLALGIVAALLARRRVVEALWIVFWAHQALASVRHVTVLVSIAAPIVAVILSEYWDQWSAGAPRTSIRGIFSDIGRELQRGFSGISVLPFAAVAVLVCFPSSLKWPQDFPHERFPISTINSHAERLQRGRVLTTDQWADYLVYRFHPRLKVFVDGRSDFYGPVLGKEYVRMSQGAYDWQALVAKHRFEVVLIPLDWPLASILKQSRNWRLLSDDGRALLFEQVQASSAGRPEKTTQARLMNFSPSTESKGGDDMEAKRVSLRNGERSRASAANSRPLETRGASGLTAWRLPSGQPLADFALGAGFVAPGLMSGAPHPVSPARSSRASQDPARRSQARSKGDEQC